MRQQRNNITKAYSKCQMGMVLEDEFGAVLAKLKSAATD